MEAGEGARRGKQGIMELWKEREGTVWTPLVTDPAGNSEQNNYQFSKD
jgi:hypothetical protein